MDKQENLHKELELIQGVIERMSHNSFLIKGWAMTLMSALVAFGKDTILASSSGAYYLACMICILIPFWWLDAFYLSQERIYRKIYERVVADPEAKTRTMYDLSAKQLGKDYKRQVSHSMWSDFMKWFYLGFIILLLTGIILKATGYMNDDKGKNDKKICCCTCAP